jgi:hypothetical protein
LAFWHQKNILWLEISMNNVPLVRVAEPIHEPAEALATTESVALVICAAHLMACIEKLLTCQ